MTRRANEIPSTADTNEIPSTTGTIEIPSTTRINQQRALMDNRLFEIKIQFHIIINIKPAAQAQVGRRKLFINCILNPTSTYATENSRKHHSGKQPTVDCTLKPIQRSGVKHSVGKVISQSNLSRQERPSKLGRSTP